MDENDWRKIIAAYEQATQGLQRTHETLRAEVSALQNYLANILASVEQGVIAIDERERITTCNPAARQILFLDREISGKFLNEIFPENDASTGALIALLRRGLREQRGFAEVEIILPLAQKRILSASVNPLRDAAGSVIGAVQTFRDLTAMKQLEEKAARQGRLAELGEMAAGVAHEIRNPLGGIELYASTLQRRLAADSREHEIAGKIGEAAKALNRIVSDMLTFTRQRDPIRKPCDPERALRAAWEMAGREREQKDIATVWKITTGGRKIALDSDQIIQAALNVILNAIQFTPEHGTLTIAAYFRTAGNGDHHGRDENLICEFIDDGPGISDENRAKIFNPFFTTRQEGTGLGLAIVHKIINDHGGTISVENYPSRGAIFSFSLPVIAAE